jgi:predicted phosphodiesterase
VTVIQNMKLQYISDIHLEHRAKIPKVFREFSACENICLLGDIGYPESKIYQQFVKMCAEVFSNVFLLYGNHEYYSKRTRFKPTLTMSQKKDHAKTLPDNVCCLDNSCVYIHKTTNKTNVKLKETDNPTDFVKLIGCTLWSDISSPDIANTINDYALVYTDENVLLTPRDTKQMFQDSKRFVLEEINKEPGIDCVLLTHHGTHRVCNGELHKNSEIATAFFTDIPELLTFKNLKACINGHTHVCIDTYVIGMHGNPIKFLSNCLGYKNEKMEGVIFDPRRLLQLH